MSKCNLLAFCRRSLRVCFFFPLPFFPCCHISLPVSLSLLLSFFAFAVAPFQCPHNACNVWAVPCRLLALADTLHMQTLLHCTTALSSHRRWVTPVTPAQFSPPRLFSINSLGLTCSGGHSLFPHHNALTSAHCKARKHASHWTACKTLHATDSPSSATLALGSSSKRHQHPDKVPACAIPVTTSAAAGSAGSYVHKRN